MGIMSINNDPKKIITKYARKDFRKTNIDDSTYSKLQSTIISALKSENVNLKEKRLECEQTLSFLNLNDFGQFAGIRVGIYAYVLAIFAIIISNSDLSKSFGINDPKIWVYFFIVFGIFVLVTLRNAEDIQRDRKLYLNFLIQCISIIDGKPDKNK